MHLQRTLALAAALLLGGFAAGCSDSSFQQPFAECGNGRLDPGEQCDDGNVLDCDACTSTCQNARCGDGLVQLGVETCDGNAFNSATMCTGQTASLLDDCTTFGFQNSGGGPGGGLFCNTSCQVQTTGCGLRLTPTHTALPTSTPPPTNTPGGATETPTPVTGPLCGDGLLTGDEQCVCAEGDDDCVPCPEDCEVGPCTVPDPAPTVAVRVDWQPPFGTRATSLTVRLAYRSTEVSLPGSGFATGQQPPANRITQVGLGSQVNVFDADAYIDVSVSRTAGVNEGRLFVANFDTCDDAAPMPGDFACTVIGCATSSGDVQGCTCSAVLLTAAPPSATRTPSTTRTATVVPTDTPENSPTPTGPTPTATSMPTGPTTTFTPTPPPTATPTSTPTATAGLCGNGNVDLDAGEDCDDGNNDEGPGDSCPANCRIESCSAGPIAATIDVNYEFAVPGGAEIAGGTFFFRYPDGIVRIPGTGSSVSVLDSILYIPDGALPAVNDQEYALTVALISDIAFAPPLLLSVQYQICPGEEAPPLSAFGCTVIEASSPPPDAVQVEGVTCTASMP